ncbi:MAG: tRNA threonylcarbamoyladenosine dehydratase [Acholeplasmatales bacterium]|nr:tRNA threonylcarbamoyladenosine dehydratase [Acholeplasmatales bacterium]
METMFQRTELLIGNEGLEKLKNANIIIFGVGGVGGYAVEGLVRAGIEKITIVDKDTVNITNINRQIIALNSTIGKNKVDVIEERIKDINPNCNVTKYQMFYLPNEESKIDLSKYDYVIDCIDTVTAKINIIERCYNLGIKVISCMGMGNKLNPLDIRISDIYKTSVCPLARTIRYELRKRNIKKLKVCYSLEEPIKNNIPLDENKKSTPGSISFVPSVAGLIIASEVIKDIIN